MVDYGLPQKQAFSRGITLAISILLSRKLSRCSARDHVGVILPPGIAGFIANFALLFCGKIPANLNFTLGCYENEKILDEASIDCVLTVSKLKDKFPDFPWPENVFFVDDFLFHLSSRFLVLFRVLIHAWLFPRHCFKSYKIHSKERDETAILLYTSGSSGNPKGVPLSEGNILANCEQLFDIDLFNDKPRVLVNLPLFHSFGLTIGMIFSTIRGLPLVCAPSPLDYKLNLKIIKQEQVEILLGTPTFLRGYLKNAKLKDLDSLRFVVAGAEKSSEEFRNRWEQSVGCEYLEGYGLTETSPAISFNLPKEGKRSGSVGRLLEGIECRTVDVDTGTETQLVKGGVLCFRGPNVFKGYWLDQTKSSEVLSLDGWFKTGDLGRIDEDGFLWIYGRVSRFSKIGGEMVPHQKVEEAINQILGLCPDEDLRLLVSARENIQKGEELVVVTTLGLNLQDLKKALREQGLPNLWMPQEIILLKEIPLLPTGKVNWKEIRSVIA
jgi:acyl-[acyl-carrier-protein]-phospholipid O-acyltransferase/long-chain-fatty-acid--[acyl-carrier-protein] ligase